MNKNKAILIFGIFLVVLVVMISSTYAIWTITKGQEDSNALLAGCLDISIVNESEEIKLEKTWPISDFEGMQLTGYTFVVKNNCKDPQDYRIDLDRLNESAGQTAMSNESLTTLLDYGYPTNYNELEVDDTTETGVKEKRILAYDTVQGNASNEHTLRLWVDEESTEQNVTFLSKIKIVAGQGISKYYTPSECFTFNSSTGAITAYDADCGGTDVVIPYEITPADETEPVAVTQVGSIAFKNKGITSVEFPRSVTYIGTGAFSNNTSLTKVVLRETLTQLGTGVFSGTLQSDGSGLIPLKFVAIPESVTSIPQSAFYCASLEQVVIPDAVTSVGTTAFADNNIKNVKIGAGLTTISETLFRNNNITELIIPDNIQTISTNAFASNPISSITFGTGLTSIGKNAFSNSNLYYTVIPSNVTSIGENAFASNPDDSIIVIQRENSEGMTLGLTWNGHATVVYEPLTVSE